MRSYFIFFLRCGAQTASRIISAFASAIAWNVLTALLTEGLNAAHELCNENISGRNVRDGLNAVFVEEVAFYHTCFEFHLLEVFDDFVERLLPERSRLPC